MIDEMQCRSLQAETFDNPSIDFMGNEIANVALTNATIHGGLQHLAVNTIEIQSKQTDRSSGVQMAVIDHRGSLSTASNVRWDEGDESLSISKLRSVSNDVDLQIYANVDFHSKTLRNFHLDKGSILSDVNLKKVKIHDSILSNVTFEQDLTLGSVTVDEIIISSVKQKKVSSGLHVHGKYNKDTMMTMSKEGMASLLVVDADGAMQDTNLIEVEGDQSSIEIKGRTKFLNSIDFNGHEAADMHITSGTIEGDEIDIHARDIKVDSIVLKPYRLDKKHTKDALAIIDADGLVTSSSSMTLQDGWIENAMFTGNVQFGEESAIHGANIQGGSIEHIQELSVDGQTTCHGGLRVVDDVYIDGSLTVDGSVSGTGPYVDLSDARYKTNVETISRDNIMDKFHTLEAVSYELKKSGMNFDDNHPMQRQIGLIAQDVEKSFPELVSTRPDGYLGVQYARFVPLILEAMKEMDDRMKMIEEENRELRRMSQEHC